jgi:ligand-binding sensor domain-containing protein/signal transduction histidine kinase
MPAHWLLKRIIPLVCCFSQHNLDAQTVVGKITHDRFPLSHVHSLTVQDGLTQSAVTAIAQDKQGFLWLATPDGLNRFDGYEIVSFQTDPNDSLAPRDNVVRALHVDRRGELWVGLSGTVGKFDVRAQKLRYVPLREVSSKSAVRGFCEDSAGNVWIATGGSGVLLLNSSGQLLHTLRHKEGDAHTISSDAVYTVAIDGEYRLWIGTDKGIDIVDPRNLHVVQSYPLRRILGTSYNAHHVSCFTLDHAGRMWIGTGGGGLYRFDEKTDGFISYRPRYETPSTSVSQDVHALMTDSRGRIYVGLFKVGLNVVDDNARVYDAYVSDSEGKSEPIGIDVNALYEDASHNLWVGAADGVQWFDLKPRKFTPMLNTKREARLFNKEYILTVLDDQNGALWVSIHFFGVFNVGLQDGIVRHFSEIAGATNFRKHVRKILLWKDGTLWFLGNFGVEHRSADGRLISRYVHDGRDSNSILAADAHTGFIDHERDIWIGYQDGQLQRLNLLSGRFHHVALDVKPKDNVPGSRSVTAIAEDSTDNVWVGRANGLFRVSRKTGRVKEFRAHASDVHSLTTDAILSIATASDGTVWVGTARGLHSYDSARDAFVRYTTEQGLPNEKIWVILADSKRRIWAGSNRGLSRIKLNDDGGIHVRNYGIADGLPAFEFIRDAAHTTSSGRLLFATVDGVFSFHPDSVDDNSHAPRVFLTGFKKFDVPVDLGEAPSTIRRITLPYSDNVFSLRFAALEFTNPSSNTYAYMMEGFEKDWTYAGTRREIRYTHLDPGEYTFRIKAANNDGVWNEEGTSVTLTILPPFWRTWWFVLLCIAASAGIFSLIMRYRINRALEIERTRTRIAADLHDELGSTLSAIALSGEALTDNPKLDAADRMRASLITDYARRTSEAMREIVWFVKPEHDSPELLLLKMREVAYTIFRETALSFEAEEEVLNDINDLDRRRDLFLIYKEALTNIAKHAQCTNVQIVLRREHGLLKLRIADDGIGFDVERSKRQGNGLGNLRQRAEKIGGHLAIESAIGKGTKVEVTLPKG